MPGMCAAIRMIIAMGGLRVSEILHSQKAWYKEGWLTLPETKNGREHIIPLTHHAACELTSARDYSGEYSAYLFPGLKDPLEPMRITSASRVAKRVSQRFEIEPFQLRDLRRTMKTHLLDREFVEEREIEIWHNHGQNADIARKHYSWAEYRQLKQRVACQIDAFLDQIIPIY